MQWAIFSSDYSQYVGYETIKLDTLIMLLLKHKLDVMFNLDQL